MARNMFQMFWVDFHLVWELVDVFHLPILQMALGLQLQFDCILVSIVDVTKIINSTLHKII